MKRILHLTVKKHWFDLIFSEEKKMEIRRPSSWIKSRLINKKSGKDKVYDIVRFRDGYNKDARTIDVHYRGYIIACGSFINTYRNGSSIKINAGDYVIRLGSICKTINI
jgi:hypothetical protein